MSPHWLQKWFGRWSNFDSATSLAGYIWYGITTATGLTVAGLAAWAASTWDWYWSTLQWAGVAAAFLSAWLVVSLGLFLTAHAVKAWRRDPMLLKDESPRESDGLRLEATGTVSDPPPFDPKGLYVGWMAVGAGSLAEHGFIEITARAFNGTGHKIYIHRASGAIKVSEIAGGSSQKIGALPPPGVINNQIKTEHIQHGEEFTVVFEQRVPSDIAAKILSVSRDNAISLDCENLDIIVISQNVGTSARLPLWDGMRLFRDPEQVQTGRIIMARIKPLRLKLEDTSG